MGINFKKLRKNMKEYREIKELYKRSFPKEERAPFWLMMRNAKKANGDFLVAFDDDLFVGFAYIISNESLAYLFYLAVNDKLRAKGYGSMILSELKERYRNKNLFLALEDDDKSAPNYEQRKKRRKFYEKNGFSPIPCRMKEASVIYDVMSIGGMVTAKEYDRLITSWAGVLIKKIVDLKIIEN